MMIRPWISAIVIRKGEDWSRTRFSLDPRSSASSLSTTNDPPQPVVEQQEERNRKMPYLDDIETMWNRDANAAIKFWSVLGSHVIRPARPFEANSLAACIFQTATCSSLKCTNPRFITGFSMGLFSGISLDFLPFHPVRVYWKQVTFCWRQQSYWRENIMTLEFDLVNQMQKRLNEASEERNRCQVRYYESTPLV